MQSWSKKSQRLFIRVILIFMLLLTFWSTLTSLQVTSPTYDEHEYISRGYLYLKTGNTDLRLRHPILLDTLAAVPLQILPDIQLSIDDPAIVEGDFHRYAARFMWEQNGNRVTHIFLLARLAPIVLLLILITAVCSWATKRFGIVAGIVALILASFDPNLLAHGRLVTPDVGQATFIFLTTYCWWRYWQKQSLFRLLITGILLGLAQTAGFPALILYPLLFVIGGLYLWQSGAWQTTKWKRLRDYIILIIISAIVIWGVYGFSWGLIKGMGFSISGPAPYYFEEFLDLLSRLSRQDIAYLNGEVYRGGRWTFFIVGLLIKTPIPILIFSAIGLGLIIYRRTVRLDAALWLIPIIYYLTALLSSLNIGYRHIMPVLPFLYLLGGSAVTLTVNRWKQWRVVVAILLGWLIVASWLIRPFYLTYFNEFVGGSSNGLNYLVISDLDWGQDLPQLQRYMIDNQVEEIYLSYFGTAPPEIYGINYQQIPAYPPRGVPGQLPFHPDYPLPGIYAISAANLVGSHFEDNPDLYDWFRTQTPTARLGNSIYIYDVSPDSSAEIVNWVSYGVSLPDVPADFVTEELGTNQIAPRWFNGQYALLFAKGRTVIHFDQSLPRDPDLDALLDQALPVPIQQEMNTEYYVLSDGQSIIEDYLATQEFPSLFANVSPSDCGSGDILQTAVSFDDTMTLLGWQHLTPISAGQPYKGLSFWRVEEPIEAPLSIFVHFLAPDGSIMAQSDGLDVASNYLQTGDIIVQAHHLNMPDNISSESCWFAVGLYRQDTLQRYSLANASGDRLFISLGSTD